MQSVKINKKNNRQRKRQHEYYSMGRTPTAPAECGRYPFSARCVADCPSKYGAGDLGHDFHRCGNGRNGDALSRGLLFYGSVSSCRQGRPEFPADMIHQVIRWFSPLHGSLRTV